MVGAVKGLIGLGGQMIQMTSHFEQTQVGLSTVLQSAEKGKQLFEDLRKLSFDTTFGVDELASASTQLLNVGVSVRDLNDSLLMLGDLAGGSKQKFSELSSIFAKIKSTGKATAEQLEMIANRGIPINQTLKQMGVTGTASAKDLTTAFKLLSGQTQDLDSTLVASVSTAGQFSGAMSNIIDTIEGKEGFITDTFKEILVNLSDASGLTDAYKSSLDTLYDALAWVNDVLADINENPIMKAIFQGVIITALGGLASVIVTALIPALVTTIAKLGVIATLKSMINPTAIAVGLGAGALVAGIIAIGNAESETEKEARKTNEELREQIKLLKDLANEQKKDTKGEYSTSDKVQTKEELLKAQIEDARRRYQKATDTINKGGEVTAAPYVAQQKALDDIKAYEQELLALQNSMTYYLAKSEDAHNKWIDDTIGKLENDYKNAQSDIADRWKDMDEAKLGNLEKELEKFKEIQAMQQNGISGAVETTGANGTRQLQYVNNWSDAEIKKTNSILNKIEKEIQDAKLKEMKTAFEQSVTDYQSFVLGQIGVNIDAEMAKIAKGESSAYFTSGGEFRGVGTETLLSNANKNFWAKYNSRAGLAEILGISETDAKKQQADNLLKSIQALVQYADVAKADDTDGRWKAGELMINQKTLQKYMDEYNKLQSEIQAAEEKVAEGLEETAKSLSDLAAKYEGTYKGMAIQAFDQLTSGTDVGVFANSLVKTGDPMKALVETLLNSLVKVLGGLEGLDAILNPITQMLEVLSPVLKTILVPTMIVNRLLVKLAEGIMWLLNVITFGFIDKAVEMYDGLIGEQEKEEEQLKKINEQYKNLISAMKEQEEYYLAMKAEINSEGYKDKLYKVNDMILTPNGTFSTHPEDTILAMKHPENLMSGNGGVVIVKPVINNNMADTASVSIEQRTNNEGVAEMIVTISKKIANDVARGVNGWDYALASREQRISGLNRM